MEVLQAAVKTVISHHSSKLSVFVIIIFSLMLAVMYLLLHASCDEALQLSNLDSSIVSSRSQQTTSYLQL